MKTKSMITLSAAVLIAVSAPSLVHAASSGAGAGGSAGAGASATAGSGSMGTSTNGVGAGVGAGIGTNGVGANVGAGVTSSGNPPVGGVSTTPTIPGNATGGVPGNNINTPGSMNSATGSSIRGGATMTTPTRPSTDDSTLSNNTSMDFNRLDADKNGQVTQRELDSAGVGSSFSVIDTDKNGVVSPAELNAYGRTTR